MYSNKVPIEDKLRCIICNTEFKRVQDRNKHLKEKHNISYEDYIVKYYFDNKYPTCMCGCGTKMTFIKSPFGKWFNKYTKNHFPRKKLSKEIKQKIKENTAKSIKKKYGVENIYYDENLKEKFVNKIKKTKLKRYDDENYNNIQQCMNTKLNKYNYHTQFIDKKFRKKYLTKKSKIEKKISSDLHIQQSTIIENKEYDIKLGNNIYEIDGDYFHPSNIDNLSFIQMNSLINDYTKNKIINNDNELTLYRVHVSDIEKYGNYTEELLKSKSYNPDYSISQRQVIMSKDYLKKFKENKGNDKLQSYVPLILKFIRTFQPTFPYPPLESDLSVIMDKIYNYNVDRLLTNNEFNNNSSTLGVYYLKSIFNSYWHGTFKNNKSVVNGWYDDKIMKKVIEYRIGLNKNNEVFDLTLHQLIRGLSVKRLAISFFKPIAASSIYNELLNNKENPIVIDPCMGFGGRLLGFISKFKNGTYIGCEPNEIIFNELVQLKQLIIDSSSVKNEQIQLHNCKWEDFKYNGKYNLVFTSIPYYDNEIYYKQDNYFTYKSLDEWKHTFINKFFDYNNVYVNMDKETYNNLGLDICIAYKLVNSISHFNSELNKKSEIIVKF